MGSGEFALLAALRPYLDGDGPGIPLGVDDDAAVVEVAGTPVVVAVDTLVDGVHVDLALSSPEDLGWKAIAANASDLAAVGATPVAGVVSLQRPPSLRDAEVHDLYRGLRAAADRYRLRLVGGDLVGSPVLAVSVTVLGELVAGTPLRRDAAAAGEVVVLVGEVGLAAAGLALHRAGASDLLAEHPALLDAHRRPRALPEAGEALALAGASACIDVSDGLGRDLGHVARLSGVRIRLDADRIPRHPAVVAAAGRLGADPLDLAVGGGDDYALVATVAVARLARVEAALEAAGLRARVLGEVTEGAGVVVAGPDGEERDVSSAGWEHGG